MILSSASVPPIQPDTTLSGSAPWYRSSTLRSAPSSPASVCSSVSMSASPESACVQMLRTAPSEASTSVVLYCTPTNSPEAPSANCAGDAADTPDERIS